MPKNPWDRELSKVFDFLKIWFGFGFKNIVAKLKNQNGGLLCEK
jgi:hypothetical protein